MVRRKMLAGILLSVGICLSLAMPRQVHADNLGPPGYQTDIVYDDSGGEWDLNELAKLDENSEEYNSLSDEIKLKLKLKKLADSGGGSGGSGQKTPLKDGGGQTIGSGDSTAGSTLTEGSADTGGGSSENNTDTPAPETGGNTDSGQQNPDPNDQTDQSGDLPDENIPEEGQDPADEGNPDVGGDQGDSSDENDPEGETGPSDGEVSSDGEDSSEDESDEDDMNAEEDPSDHVDGDEASGDEDSEDGDRSPVESEETKGDETVDKTQSGTTSSQGSTGTDNRQNAKVSTTTVSATGTYSAPARTSSTSGNRSDSAYSGFNYFFNRNKTDSQFTQVAKVYAVPAGDFDLIVREGQSFLSRVVGIVPSDGLAYVLSEGEKWLYIESGDVRGFVLRESLVTGADAEALMAGRDEKSFLQAIVRIDPSDNKALLYTKTTAKETGNFLSDLRMAIVNKSMEYLGNRYVWGGTSLTDGCDCSGFVQSLFKLFGISLPRVSRDQANAGIQIPVADAKPGDLLFYETDGVVSHVLMAIGDGKAINAANSRQGIIISDIDPARAVRACRVIMDGAGAGFQSNADGAAYTQDEIELIWAIVAQEDDTSYEGALGVISSAMNRADANYGGYGTTAYAQLTADGQFCYSPKISDPSYWQRRLGGNVPEYVKTAVSDCLTQGIRNNSFLNFRSSNRTGNYVQIGSNWYF
ncbi:MAG: C40 family peptidase [Lachnospiraceae bacterium]|nr:C40 family peptidase [Candidatus Equihabitans merdae]